MPDAIGDLTIVITPPPAISTTLQPPAQTTTTLAVGQGPAGPQGLQGVRGDVVLELVAAATINGHRAIADNGAGQAVHADAATLAHGLAIVGISDGAAALGAVVSARTGGPMHFSGWSWAPGPVFLGLDGVLTQSVPPSAVIALVLGYGNGEQLTINIQPAVALQ